MNQNTKAAFKLARKAFGRIKHGRPQKDDVALAANVGYALRKSKFAKVARGL